MCASVHTGGFNCNVSMIAGPIPIFRGEHYTTTITVINQANSRQVIHTLGLSITLLPGILHIVP